MLESMEGRRAMPRLKPPFPSQVGYLGRPTLIQNVETLAHIPAILRSGGEWWAGLGTRGASGTRLWSVTGAVARPGCYEAPSGVTTRELVDEHAGGFTDDVGAVVPGGAASGILPPAALDAPLTRDGLREYGAGPGSAAVQVFPSSYSPLRLLAETMRFFAEESCQKCTPCRIGNRALHHVFEVLAHDEAAMTRRRSTSGCSRWRRRRSAASGRRRRSPCGTPCAGGPSCSPRSIRAESSVSVGPRCQTPTD